MKSLKGKLNEYGSIVILLVTIVGSAWLSTNGLKQDVRDISQEVRDVRQDVRDLREDMREDRREILAAIESLRVEIGADIKRLEGFHLTANE